MASTVLAPFPNPTRGQSLHLDYAATTGHLIYPHGKAIYMLNLQVRRHETTEIADRQRQHTDGPREQAETHML